MSIHTPPRFGRWIIRRFMHASLQEVLEGDLYEMYQEDLETKGVRRARRNYVVNAVLFLRHHRLRNSNNNTHMSLIINYVKVAVRDLQRHRSFTAINLTGLVAGFLVSLFMLQYVLHELSYDRFHSKADRIYRVINDRYQNGELIQHGTITYPTIGALMEDDFAEVVNHTRMTISNRSYVEYGEKILSSENRLIADEQFFQVFDFKILYGDPMKSHLDDPYEVVITETFARSLVGNEQSLQQVLGATLTIDGDMDYTVTAITAEVPTNSHLQFDLVTSYASFIVESDGGSADNSMSWSDFYHYVEVQEQADISLLRSKMDQFGHTHFGEGEVSGAVERFYLQPLVEAHLDASNEYEIGEVIDGKIIWILLFIAVLIVIVAWVNYTNLATSRALQRAKEAGVRKSLGAGKLQIVLQIAVESFLLNVGALCLAIVLALFLQGFFNQLIDKELTMAVFVETEWMRVDFLLVFLLIFSVSVTALSLYPGSIIASFNMKEVIKGRTITSNGAIGFRRALIVFQFCISMLLIVGAITVTQQIAYMMNKDLGMDIRNTLVVNGPGLTQFDSTFIPKIEVFKSELSELSGIQQVTATGRVAGRKMGRLFNILSSADPNHTMLSSSFIFVNHEYTDLYGIELLAGRSFQRSDHDINWANVTSLVINEAAMKHFKFATPEEAVGGKLDFWDKQWTIVGVVRDYHQLSMHHQIEPIMLMPIYSPYSDFTIKLAGDQSQALLATIEKRFLEVFPGNYFQYYFLEDRYYTQYENEERVAQIMNLFTVLSLLIAALGLYGMLLITVSRKTKEIGIRRVLGASLLQVMREVGSEFFLLIGVAICIGIPVSYYLMGLWQSNYAYAVSVDAVLVGLSAAALLLTAAVVVYAQLRKVTTSNPSETLRYE